MHANRCSSVQTARISGVPYRDSMGWIAMQRSFVCKSKKETGR